MISLIKNSNLLLNDLSLQVTLDDSYDVKLLHNQTIKQSDEDRFGRFEETKHLFSSVDKTILTTLVFKSYEKMVLAYVDAVIKNDPVQNQHKYLAPDGGITIKVKGIGSVQGLMANYQHKDWWTRPTFNKDISELPKRTQSLLWKSDDQFNYLLPIVDAVYRTELLGNGEEGLSIKLSSYTGGYDRCQTLAFVMGFGKNPFQLTENTVAAALEHLGFPTLPREKKRYPEILDFLGWCSWDAFYDKVNEQGMIQKMDELKEKNIPVKWAMIDDGWLDVKDRRLWSFSADDEKFPNDLKSVVEQLKTEFGVRWVGVWHTIVGYWGGVHPDSELAKVMEPFLYTTKSGKKIPYPNASKGFGFWNAWHKVLKQQGIDFVKVDSQSAIKNFMMYQDSIGEAARGTHNALDASAGLHFNQCIINCMGMAAENIWNRPISAVSRNSDDFVPQEMGSFKEHALQNAYNSLYHGAFYWGDWDMYWTTNHDDKQNMILRTISGGPIYFSDPVGGTNPEMIWPLVYKDGRIIRPDQPGVPTEDCLFINPLKTKTPLKIWNQCNGAGILASFNIFEGNEPVHGVIAPSDIPDLDGETFLVYDVLSKRSSIVSNKEKLDIELPEDEVALHLIIPIQDTVTPIGLTNKLICQHCLLHTWPHEKGLKVMIKEGGVFAFMSESRPQKVTVNGQVAAIQQDDVNEAIYTIDCSDLSGEVLLEIEI
ncbi:MAG TPA: Sip1-related alpha-galactosidase [Candidatus Angelobacter sp.]|nr:Sip1-related alpha-galactosidase [Candidatus Angelobacter sp.]